MESAFLKIFIFFSFTHPKSLIARPGPGKGCLFKKGSGTLSSLPYTLTSSLNNSDNGSSNFSFIFFGNPPTL